ncbi:MAG: c-type cytochrome [Fimbriimonadaceae bacterium]
MTTTSVWPFREWLVASIAGLVGAQVVVGIGEALSYRATVAAAYKSESALRSSAAGAIATGFHYWASAALLLITMALLLEMVWNEGYREVARWYGALGCTIAAFVFQVTGNLLPMDRHGAQTAVVEAGIAGRAPLLGHAVSLFMLRGNSVSDSTLGLWWAAHAYILPACVLIATSMLVRRKAARLWVFAVAPIAVLIVAILVHAPLGSAATPLDFDQYNARVSWYTWPLHAMLGAFGRVSANLAWVGSIGIPTLITLGLVFLPWIGKRAPIKLIRGLVLLTTASFLLVGGIFGGPVAALTGNRDPAVQVVASGSRVKSTDPKVLALVQQGRQAFNSVGCTDCHGKDATKGDGGPALTSDYLIHTDPTWFEQLIRNPKSVNPSATMPPFPNLAQAQVQAIATFLSQPP